MRQFSKTNLDVQRHRTIDAITSIHCCFLWYPNSPISPSVPMLSQHDMGMYGILVGYSYFALDMVVWFWFIYLLFSTSLVDYYIEKRDNLRIFQDKGEKSEIKEERYLYL